jgi:hypothetical protein
MPGYRIGVCIKHSSVVEGFIRRNFSTTRLVWGPFGEGSQLISVEGHSPTLKEALQAARSLIEYSRAVSTPPSAEIVVEFECVYYSLWEFIADAPDATDKPSSEEAVHHL